MTKTILIVGARGGVGGETARALLAHGWTVRGLARTRGSEDAIDWRIGDALKRDDVLAAATGVDVIMHAVNPPGYRNWASQVLPMLDNSLAAASLNQARLVLPGTIYNYDPQTTMLAAPDTLQRPNSRKGAIRAEMERRIEAAGVRALILRSGDYFGPRSGNGWLSQAMIRPGKPIRRVIDPGRAGVGHGWAYLPDVAETFARLLDREDALPHVARYHFEGYWDATGTGFVEAIARAAGQAKPRRWAFPWALLPLLAPFNETFRELIEMKPFWRNPLWLDNHELVSLLGAEPRTPLDEALRATLRALQCI